MTSDLVKILTGLTLFLVTFAVSWAGVGYFRRWSERKGIVDVPNERSSHEVPTPRGGGLVIAVICIAGYLGVGLATGNRISWGYIIGSVIVVAISWLDDLRSVSSAVRLACHAAAAFVFILDAGVVTSIEIPGWAGEVGFGVAAPLITFVWIVWVVNAYNFMDGIDGIAGTQAITAATGWAVTAYLASAFSTYYFGVVIAAAAGGFLVHNWQPAKLFMGDAGSAFLGFTFAVIPVLAARDIPEAADHFALAGIILLWFFLFDSLLTFLRRAIAGERVWTAHREHIYQRIVRSGRSHAFVSLVYGLFSTLAIAAFIFFWLKDGMATWLILLILATTSAALPFFRLSKKNVDVIS